MFDIGYSSEKGELRRMSNIEHPKGTRMSNDEVTGLEGEMPWKMFAPS
jgi:hypothetical protein